MADSMDKRNKSDTELSNGSNRKSGEGLKLSISVENALKELQRRGKPVGAAAIVDQIFEVGPNHKEEYAKGAFRSFTLEDSGREESPENWFAEVENLFDPESMKEWKKDPVLEGRLLIAGLALLDSKLFEKLQKNGVFASLIEELNLTWERFRMILGNEGKKKLDGKITDTVHVWSDDPLSNTKDDQLGRKAFARFLAKRIAAVDPDSDAHPIHLNGPWGAGKSTLLNFLREELNAIRLPLFDIDPACLDDFKPVRLSGDSKLRKKFEQHNENLSKKS